VKIHPVIADTGRPGGPSGGTAHLLNAGWTFTTAVPLPGGGYTLPGQALAVFVEGTWAELNRPHPMVIELVDDEREPANLLTPTGLLPVRFEQEITIPSVPTAPNGTPGLTTFLIEVPQGSLQIGAARRRFIWRVTVGGVTEEVGFWVNAPTVAPRIGGGVDAVPPQT
jgi:hypothetical protein